MQKLFVEIYEQLNELNENVIEPALRLNEIGGDLQSLMARQHLRLVEACLAEMAKQLRAMGEAHDPRELVTRQAELAGEWRVALLDLGQKLDTASDSSESSFQKNSGAVSAL